MKKRKYITALLALVMTLSSVCGIGTAYGATGIKKATLNNAKVRFNNGAVQTVQCYNVDGYNFVRARDVTNNLNMWIDTIGKNKPGVVVATYSTPVATGKLETLTQKKAKVNVVNGRILYEGWESPAECFLLNGRYYFKLADFEKASDHYYDICFEIVERKAKNPTIKEYGGSKKSGITVEWNNNTKVIDVNRIEVDLPQLFKDIRASEKIEVEEEVKYPVKEDIKKEDNKQDEETVIEKEERIKGTGILKSAPKEGEVLANILIDEDEGAYLDNGSVNRDNFTYPYTLYPDSHVGQCTWYAEGRFMETTGVDMKINNLTGGSVAAWVKSAKSDECPDLDGTTDPYEIEAGCMGIFKGHALFVEWVDFDRYGNPETVYFTEGNTQHVGKYYPEYDAKVQVMDFEDFIERQPFVGYVVTK